MAANDGIRIPLRDQLWLLMDRPDNLMYINCLVWFAEIPDWDEVTRAIQTRMVRRFSGRSGGLQRTVRPCSGLAATTYLQTTTTRDRYVENKYI